jgi:flagellar biogenesis protein FliO
MNEMAAGAAASAAGPLALPAAAGMTAATVEEPAPVAGAADGRLWSSFLVTLVALAFVLALAWLLLRLFRRLMKPRAASGQMPLEVVQALGLGGRERLLGVRHDQREYVLGVTAASVSLIDKRVLGAQELADAGAEGE